MRFLSSAVILVSAIALAGCIFEPPPRRPPPPPPLDYRHAPPPADYGRPPPPPGY